MSYRLDQYLTLAGEGSRSQVKQFLKKGLVQVDGITEKQAKRKVLGNEQITLNGKPVYYEEHCYLMLHKPAGVVTATEDKKEKTVMDLITEGLLLVTNDGELAHRLLSPKKHVDKCYFTRVTGQIHEEDIHRFKEGLDIGDEKKTLPADLEILSSGEISEAKVTICEGRYHQVKRMFEAIGCKVIYLKRLSMGSLTLDPALEKGAFRKLTEEEIAALLQPPRKEKE